MNAFAPGSGPSDPGVERDADDLYEDAPCGYVSTLLDGTIVRMNRTLLGWLGHRRDDVVGSRRLHELLVAGDRIYFETHVAPLLQMQGEVRAIAVQLLRADGSFLPCLLNAVLRTADGATPTVIRAAVFDATDRRSYEQELLRAREEARSAEEHARELARTLQDSFLPPELPDILWLDVGGAYHPVGQGVDVGGDFYDVFETSEGAWAVLVGDVSGKGIEAAGVTSLARYTARGAAIRTTRPSTVLEAVNTALMRDRSDRSCTLAYAKVRRFGAGVRMTVSSGGHPLPLRAAADGRIETLGRYGTVLGMFDDVTVHDDTVDLDPGDVVILYTDGVTDGRRAGEFFGDERLRSALADVRDAGADEIARTLAERVVAFQDGWPRDDVAVVALKVRRPDDGASSGA